VSGRVIQGWHSDPFGVHEARYFSAGQPTKLVRDGGTESYDEPPSGADEVAAAMARLSAPPAPPAPPSAYVPSAYAPRDAYPYGPASERGPRRGTPAILALAASGIILVAAAVAAVHTIMHPAKPARPSGAADVAFVTQAATRTLQQHTVDLVLSGSAVAGSTRTETQGTAAFALSGQTGTLNMTTRSPSGVTAIREISLNGHVYVATSVNGRSLLPKGKAWIAESIPSQGSDTTGFTGQLTGGNLTTVLTSLENQGITVGALGTKVIGGISCTGYTVTAPGEQGSSTVWIDPQNLVREISLNTTISIMVNGASPSPGSASAPSLDLTMDFSYSAAPLRLTAPPAASTISFDAFLQQLGQNPALKQLEQSSAS
jgi:hypothetical protein